MIALKINEPVFVGTATMSSGTTLTPFIKITNSALASTQLKDVLVLTNFDVSAQNVATGFPYTGTWYNLMDNTSIAVTNVNATINIPAGQYRIYGNKVAALAIANFESKENAVYLYPNPVGTYFTLNSDVNKVEIFSIAGQLLKTIKTNSTVNFQYGVSDLAQGIYVVKAYNQEEQVKVMKFIKN